MVLQVLSDAGQMMDAFDAVLASAAPSPIPDNISSCGSGTRRGNDHLARARISSTPCPAGIRPDRALAFEQDSLACARISTRKLRGC